MGFIRRCQRLKLIDVAHTLFFIKGNMQHYASISRQIREIFARYTDIIEPLSLDEAYLDVTHNKFEMKSATLIAQKIQRQVLKEVGLTCSIGVSYNKFIAKVASDFKKPYGLTVITPQQAQDFLDKLPIEKFYGVGSKSVPIFHEMNIHTGADLRAMSLDDLMKYFGKMGYSLYLKVRGVHHAAVSPKRERKSLGREMTFTNFLQNEANIYEVIGTLGQKVSELMQQKHLKAQTLTLKIRYDNFETHTRQVTQEEYFDSKEECEALALQLWDTYGDTTRAIRLLGISVSKFENPYFTPIKLDI